MGRSDPIKPFIYGLVPVMFAVFLIVILPPALTLFGYIAEAVLATSIGYAISSDKVADMKDALNQGARAFQRQRAEVDERRESPKPRKTAISVATRPTPVVEEPKTYPQRIEEQDAPSVPQNVTGNKRRAKK